MSIRSNLDIGVTFDLAYFFFRFYFSLLYKEILELSSKAGLQMLGVDEQVDMVSKRAGQFGLIALFEDNYTLESIISYIQDQKGKLFIRETVIKRLDDFIRCGLAFKVNDMYYLTEDGNRIAFSVKYTWGDSTTRFQLSEELIRILFSLYEKYDYDNYEMMIEDLLEYFVKRGNFDSKTELIEKITEESPEFVISIKDALYNT